MNNTVLAAIVARLTGDTTLDGLLARSVISTTAPGVYSTLPVPQSAALPFVVVSGPVTDTPDDAFDAQYRDVLIDLHAYDSRPDDGGGSVARVNNIAERVRFLFHRKPLHLGVAYRCLVSECRGPVALDDDVSFGRVMTLRLLIGAV